MKSEKTILSGIYKITNIKNNKIYIGQSKNLEKREYSHFYDLKVGHHANKHLQNACNKYGIGSFIFKKIASYSFYDKNCLNKQEEFLIKQIENNKPGALFNILKKSNSSERMVFSKTPEETRAKMSKAAKYFWENTTEKIRKEKSIKCSNNMKKIWLDNDIRKKEHSIRSKKMWQEQGKELGKKISITQKNFSKEKKEKLATLHSKIREKEFEVVSPGGILYKDKNITKFAKTHNLLTKNLSSLILGKQKSHKGWKLLINIDFSPPGKRTYDVLVKDPSGNIHGPIIGLYEFSRINSLTPENFSSLIHGRLKSHKKWTLIKGLEQ